MRKCKHLGLYVEGWICGMKKRRRVRDDINEGRDGKFKQKKI